MAETKELVANKQDATQPVIPVMDKDGNRMIKMRTGEVRVLNKLSGEYSAASFAKDPKLMTLLKVAPPPIPTKTSQIELMEVFLAGGKTQTFHSTGKIVAVNNFNKDLGLDFFAATTEGVKVKISKNNEASINSLGKDTIINVTFRFNAVRANSSTNEALNTPDEERTPEQNALVASHSTLMNNAVEYTDPKSGNTQKGYVLFDSVEW